jgi:hypothetical protein
MRQICSGFPDDFRGVLHVSSGAIRSLLRAVEQRPELAGDPLHKPSAPETNRAVGSCGRCDSHDNGSCDNQADQPNRGDKARSR